MGNYLNSLDRIAALDVEVVLPGHRNIIHDCQGRINELKNHHQARLANVLDILGSQRLTGTQVAKQMKWDLTIKEWHDFPWGQKLFAVGEAMSHLLSPVSSKGYCRLPVTTMYSIFKNDNS